MKFASIFPTNVSPWMVILIMAIIIALMITFMRRSTKGEPPKGPIGGGVRPTEEEQDPNGKPRPHF